MSAPITSQERAHLNAWWQRYDAATTPLERSALRTIIELYIVGATWRRCTSEIQNLHEQWRTPK